MLILFLCKCANAICMSKCLIFHSVSILISSAVPLMGYWLLCYVPFIISLFPPLLWCLLTWFWDEGRGLGRGTPGIAWMGSYQIQLDHKYGGLQLMFLTLNSVTKITILFVKYHKKVKLNNSSFIFRENWVYIHTQLMPLKLAFQKMASNSLIDLKTLQVVCFFNHHPLFRFICIYLQTQIHKAHKHK